ncbi:MAG: hypothetical protein JO100_17845 [Pseudonocardia sp.]|nr:hypothetical protein [Pseudonocardia sp.]
MRLRTALVGIVLAVLTALLGAPMALAKGNDPNPPGGGNNNGGHQRQQSGSYQKNMSHQPDYSRQLGIGRQQGGIEPPSTGSHSTGSIPPDKDKRTDVDKDKQTDADKDKDDKDKDKKAEADRDRDRDKADRDRFDCEQGHHGRCDWVRPGCDWDHHERCDWGRWYCDWDHHGQDRDRWCDSHVHCWCPDDSDWNYYAHDADHPVAIVGDSGPATGGTQTSIVPKGAPETGGGPVDNDPAPAGSA